VNKQRVVNTSTKEQTCYDGGHKPNEKMRNEAYIEFRSEKLKGGDIFCVEGVGRRVNKQAKKIVKDTDE
jgi:hypothetical protein